MKEIIYLDTSFLHSFIAQLKEGLPTSHVREFLEQETQTTLDATQKESTHEVSGEASTGSVTIPQFFATPSGKGAYKYINKNRLDNSFTLSQLDAGKEIISKQLHDNALSDFEEYLNDDNVYCTTNDAFDKQIDIGKYIKIIHPFEIFDLSYVKKSLDVSILKEMALLANSGVVPAKNGQKKLNPDVEKGMNSFDVILRFLTNILPSNLCIRQGNFISALKEKYVRETNSELIFKYGTKSSLKLTVLGKVTREFDEFDIDMFNKGGMFSHITESITGVTRQFIDEVKLIKKGDIIISPIAIYFE
ncbi:hypothetical protein PM3016_5414 [Paenibacillus mucilaginosus 3016]|uniref:Uncharacterized protein n=1 Tax=Paenibacillus mucilaginosus 3016 TaxID=1116391 RepID=H6NDR5_9BACL|nr:hypothetical protein [Paenibacillus mucilaginosus]AFC32114.1 hypothetical protein PM3016_5414 [Paenibacillus mucilaginosus 3016]WFA20619.1 hypothetical protein ERY13_26960 [Paenibacillus mucilaginosus]